MNIGILQTGHAPDALRPTFGDYEDRFRALLGDRGFTFRTWNVVDMDMPGEINAADGWLITGSRHGAYEDHPFIPPLEEFIRAVHAARRPMVGICFGHQIIAQALGGRVERFAGGWTVGRQVYDWGGEALHLNAWHQDQVTALPPGARVLASSDSCAHAALAFGDHILTVQAHPEFGHDFIAGLIESRGPGIVPDDLLDRARAGLGAPVDNDRLADRMAACLGVAT